MRESRGGDDDHVVDTGASTLIYESFQVGHSNGPFSVSALDRTDHRVMTLMPCDYDIVLAQTAGVAVWPAGISFHLRMLAVDQRTFKYGNKIVQSLA
ncbi:MAG TPA: hypothetical protein VH331_18490 [Allosphingosinicella sp.]|nr:hypothetical protein [Allosphingosinicella sp.]